MYRVSWKCQITLGYDTSVVPNWDCIKSSEKWLKYLSKFFFSSCRMLLISHMQQLKRNDMFFLYQSAFFSTGLFEIKSIWLRYHNFNCFNALKSLDFYARIIDDSMNKDTWFIGIPWQIHDHRWFPTTFHQWSTWVCKNQTCTEMMESKLLMKTAELIILSHYFTIKLLIRTVVSSVDSNYMVSGQKVGFHSFPISSVLAKGYRKNFWYSSFLYMQKVSTKIFLICVLIFWKFEMSRRGIT